MPIIDKLACLFIENRKLLCARSKGKDLYYIPGGKREKGETDQEALIREIREELTVTLKPDTIKYLETFQAQAHGKPEGTLVKITCYSSAFEGQLKPASEIEELQWLGYADKAKCSLAGILVMDWLKSKALID